MLMLLNRVHAAHQPFITFNRLSEAERFNSGRQQHQAEETGLDALLILIHRPAVLYCSC